MSILNLMRYTVTDLDYEKLRNSNKFLGSLYYILWSILMILILANVFIAILSDAYSTISNEEDEEDLIDSIKRNLAESMVKIKRKSKALTTMISWKRKSTKNIFADTDKIKTVCCHQMRLHQVCKCREQKREKLFNNLMKTKMECSIR